MAGEVTRGPGAGDEPREVALPRTERHDAPLYLARYHQRRAREATPDPGHDPAWHPPGGSADDGDVPLYLRRFRARQGGALPAVTDRADEALAAFGRSETYARNTRTKEIVAGPEARPGPGVETLAIHVVRHGETQGYSVDGGLTPMGRWQARRRGHDLSKAIRDGEQVRLVCAPTTRATQTAEQLRLGLEDGFELWGTNAAVDGPEPMAEFRNFQVWMPDGRKDPTQAFREYHAVLERYERVALGDRPLWLVELDRFWRTQLGGGDPIALWMSLPMLHFEPPTLVVLRFWAGFARLAAAAGADPARPPDGREAPTRVVCATHSGPMRALATAALGHDAGEPYNTEEVVVQLRRDLAQATLTYRNRTQQLRVPLARDYPEWAPRPPAEAGYG